MHCMRVQVCQNKELFLKGLCHLIISVSCVTSWLSEAVPEPFWCPCGIPVWGWSGPSRCSGWCGSCRLETRTMWWRDSVKSSRKTNTGNSTVLFRIRFLRTQSGCFHVWGRGHCVSKQTVPGHREADHACHHRTWRRMRQRRWHFLFQP